MRPRILFSAWIVLTILFLLFCSLTFATKTRLSGMGDLSIVIEDESNMINLWDFAQNPAAFLTDEKGSVLRGDLSWDTYKIEELPYYNHLRRLIFNFKADGNILNNRVSASFRKEDDFALGFGGDYLFRQTDADYDEHKVKYPSMVLVLSKSVNRLTAVGADVRYLDYDFDFSRVRQWRPSSELQWREESVEALRTQIGVTRKFHRGPEVGVVLGYERTKLRWIYGDWYVRVRDPRIPIHYYFYPIGDSIIQTGWVSGQTLIDIWGKARLIMEGMVQFLENQTASRGRRNRFCFKARGVYDLSSRLRLGGFFADADSYAEYSDPVYSYFSSIRYETLAREWGLGSSVRLHRKVLAGIEYHFRDHPQPYEPTGVIEPWDLKSRSWHVGVEANVSEALSLRAGYIGSRVTREPDQLDREDTWQNRLTLGWGLQPQGRRLTLEFSYCSHWTRYHDWFGGRDVESGGHVFSFSFKRAL